MYWKSSRSDHGTRSKMKKSLISIFLALLMLTLPIVSVYAQDGDPPECLGDPLVAYLMAGQTILAGELIICNDATNLYISYVLYEEWRLSDSHVQIDVIDPDLGVSGTIALDDYPVNKKGTPVPGQFDYQMDYDPTVTASTYTIPLANIIEGWGGTYDHDLLIAAHATLGDKETNDVGTGSFTGSGPFETTLSVPFLGDEILDSSLTIACVDDSTQEVVSYVASLNVIHTLPYPVSDLDFSDYLLYSGEPDILVITPDLPPDPPPDLVVTCTLDASVVTPGAGEETAWAYNAESGGEFGDITDTKRWSAYLVYSLQPPPALRDEQWPVGGTATIAFEDFPFGSDGDYDYNDWVVDIDTTATFAGTSNDLVQITFVIMPEARGAAFWHVFYLGIPENTFGSGGQYTLTFFDAGGVEIPGESETGIFEASTRKDFDLFYQTLSVRDAFDDLYKPFPNTIEPEGIVSHYPDIFNTIVTAPEHSLYQPSLRTAKLSIVFGAPAPFDLNAYDPYDPGNMHGEGLFFDPWLWVDPRGLPMDPYEVHVLDGRLLAVPADWMWQEAGVPIWMAYPKVGIGDPPVFESTWWCNPDWIFNSSPYLASLVYNGPFPEPTFPTCP